jgi:hypothetical protein
MKNLFFAGCFFAISVTSCNNSPSVLVKNELNVDRQDEVIVLTRTFIEQKLQPDEGFSPVFESDGQVLPCQFDDLDGDGNWDEAAVLVNLKALQESKIKLRKIAAEKYPVFEKRTNLRLGILQEDGSYKEVEEYNALPCSDGFEIIAQAESVNWENDKIAFRVYFDCRNVKDLFGKLKPEMIIDKIHTPELTNYHELADWGMDVLHCGSSLGSGGLALMRNDSLYRLGSTDVYRYKKIVEGPVRSVFELNYAGWHVEGDSLEATEKITIYPGKYWFESDVTIKGIRKGDQVITGIVTSKLKKEPFEMSAGKFACIGTHDVQSLNNDELGMAILVPVSETGKIARTTNIDFFKLGNQTVIEKSFSNIISETCYISQHINNGVPAKHYFSAVWGLEKEQWRTEDGFKKYLSEEGEKLSSPLKIY